MDAQSIITQVNKDGDTSNVINCGDSDSGFLKY